MSAAAAAPAGEPPHASDLEFTARLGMWVFIATEVLFFGGLMLAYLYARTQWPRGFALASRHTDVVLGTLNTALLLTSSAAVAMAVACRERAGLRARAASLLALTAALGVAFLVVKGVEYAHEWKEGLFPDPGFVLATPGAELFFLLYFLMTGIHAVHLAIGIAGVGAFAWGEARQRRWSESRRVDAMALYWHFVDVIWIYLYPLLYLVERHR